jgi:DNA polymerase I-like protein with 3'-5' exonuclease and polymerase domains
LFPGIAQFMRNRENDVAQLGYVETPLGLRRHFPIECLGYHLTRNRDMFGKLGSRLGYRIYNKAIRESYNFYPQGGVAYLTNKAMMELVKRFKSFDWSGRIPPTLSLQVHDALIVRAHKSVFIETINLMREVMVSPIIGDVVIPVEFSIGWDLRNKQKIVDAVESVFELDWDKVKERLTKRPDLLQFVEGALSSQKEAFNS